MTPSSKVKNRLLGQGIKEVTHLFFQKNFFLICLALLFLLFSVIINLNRMFKCRFGEPITPIIS